MRFTTTRYKILRYTIYYTTYILRYKEDEERSNCSLQRHAELGLRTKGRSPDTRLEGHLGRRTARDHSLVVQHKFYEEDKLAERT